VSHVILTRGDSRYKSSLIQAETYLLACQRYIELNPVRAAMVQDPAHYRWTSYRANGLGQQDALITPHPLYLALGQTSKRRQAAYRALFLAQLDADPIGDIRLALNQNQPLGNSRFYAKIEKVTGQRREPKPRGRPRVTLDESANARQRKLGL
jgi:putative transposase